MPADFFISYASPDKAWAEWIAWVLEEDGATAVLQAWDFRPGSNFVLEMQRAAATAERTIAILSPDYLQSSFAAPEWAAAFANDPGGMKRSLIPIRVRDCALGGLLKTTVYIDLVALNEGAARKQLRDGLAAKRGKPDRAPAFPGVPAPGHGPAAAAKPFPGKPTAPSHPATGIGGSTPYIPKIPGTVSDLDRARFINHAFAMVRNHFEAGLNELARQPAIDVDFTARSDTEFLAEVFVNGKRAARGRVWLNGRMGGGYEISYYEGEYDMGNALNEALTIADDRDTLALSAVMNMGFTRLPNTIDPRRMSPEDAGEYLWRRFVARLEAR
jgi:hypothetical protein